jgi:NAD(P) transhydrogenase subunit alpha
MDALSSMATLAGYKAVLVAAARLRSIFPLLSSAAGTLYPAKVLVLGAGVSGLQAIATAHRLGALVEAFDPRPAVREQVSSLGALFIEMPLQVNPKIETAGGYASEQSEEFLAQERATISARLAKVDVVICTAQVFGKAAPRLITREMLDLLKPGAVVIDLAIEQGGNCELAEPDKWVEYNNIALLGAANLPATLPVDASTLYSRNLCNFFSHIYPPDTRGLTLSDEITWASCATHAGKIVNPLLGQPDIA